MVNIGGFFNNLGNTIKSTAVSASNTVANNIVNVVNNPATTFKPITLIPATIKPAVSTAVNAVANTATTVVKPAVSTAVNTVANTATTSANAVANTATNLGTTAINKIVDTANLVGNTLENLGMGLLGIITGGGGETSGIPAQQAVGEDDSGVYLVGGLLVASAIVYSITRR